MNAGQRETWEVYQVGETQNVVCVFECQSPGAHGFADWRQTCKALGIASRTDLQLKRVNP